MLSYVHRQSDNHLIQAINELERGLPSEQTNKLLTNKCRPLNPNAIRLFARNTDVDLYNYPRLQELDNPLDVFESNDCGDNYYLNTMLAPKGPITVNNFASLFNCTPVGRASDSVMAQ